MLSRLIYASIESRNISSEDIEQILAASRKNNLVDGVTGMLCHGNGRFLQYLEGDETPVKNIYNRISEDDRHKDVVILDRANLERRIFGDWSMGFINVENILTEITLNEITKSGDFCPEKLDATTAFQLIKRLKASLSDQVILD